MEIYNKNPDLTDSFRIGHGDSRVSRGEWKGNFAMFNSEWNVPGTKGQ